MHARRPHLKVVALATTMMLGDVSLSVAGDSTFEELLKQGPMTLADTVLTEATRATGLGCACENEFAQRECKDAARSSRGSFGGALKGAIIHVAVGDDDVVLGPLGQRRAAGQ